MNDTKKLQALKRKLRTKYGYSTNTDYSRGLGLIKPTDDENGDFCFYVSGNQTVDPDVTIYVNGKRYRFTHDELYTIVDAIKEFDDNIVWTRVSKKRNSDD